MRSAFTAASMPSNTVPSTPSGLSSVFSRNGGTAAMSIALRTRSLP